MPNKAGPVHAISLRIQSISPLETKAAMAEFIAPETKTWAFAPARHRRSNRGAARRIGV